MNILDHLKLLHLRIQLFFIDVDIMAVQKDLNRLDRYLTNKLKTGKKRRYY